MVLVTYSACMCLELPASPGSKRDLMIWQFSRLAVEHWLLKQGALGSTLGGCWLFSTSAS